MTASASDLPDLVAFDLDDTLAPSKAAMPEPMAAALRLLLSQVPVCIISGGQISQFRNQVLTHLGAAPDELARLHLMPTCGTRYYTHAGGRGAGTEESEWTLVYANDLSPAQVAQGFAVVEEQARRLGLWSERTWGPALEDRGSQITFSALGQEAPIDAKRAWDPTGEKRATLRDAVAPLLPGLEVRSGGATSIDITLEGVDKAYGLKRLAAVTGIGLERMLFIGDRLDPEGNDYPVKVLGVPCHAVTGWRDTAEFVTALAGDLAAARKA